MPDDTTITTLEEALSALREARADAAKQRTKAKSTQEALDAMTTERDTLQGQLKDAEEGADALSALLEEIQERADLDLSGLEGAKSGEEIGKALDAAFKPLSDLKAQATETATLRAEATYRDAAEPHNWDAKKLKRIVPNLTTRDVEQDGQKVPEYGVLDGDKWTPLTDAASGFEAALKRDAAQPDKPAPAPLPTGQRGGTPAPADPVADLNARLFGQPKRSTT